MGGKKVKIAILGVLVLVVGYIVYDTTSIPGVQSLAGNFEEVAFYRNENNTGPIIRIYAVTVEDTLWEEMQQYGEFMPHTKYGSTKVYFFRASNPAPTEVFPGQENFDARYSSHLLAQYEKDAMGQVSFRKMASPAGAGGRASAMEAAGTD
jgi:hypothetical protein